MLLLTGVAMATNLDVRFEEALAKDTSLPAFLVDPTRSLENSNAVQKRLASLRPESPFATRQKLAAQKTVAVPTTSGSPGSRLRRCRSSAPRPTSPTPSSGSTRPATGRSASPALRGHVVLVDFWTYTCINCIRTLPFLKGLYATYHRYGLDIVGVETPEFTFEQEAGNVQQAIHSDGLRYPVVQDNRYGTWNAYGNQYWPAEYLIDADGQVRHTQFGEGDYKQSEAAVRTLLYQAGAHKLPPPMTRSRDHPVGQARDARDLPGRPAPQGFDPPLAPGDVRLPGRLEPAAERVRAGGRWNVNGQSATPQSPGAAIQGACRRPTSISC